MESDRYPIEINGETYMVDRTFSGDPAVFQITGKMPTGQSLWTHISEVGQTAPKLVCFEPGDIVIVAKRKTA